MLSGAGDVVQLVKYLPSMYEALGSISSTTYTRCGGTGLQSQHEGYDLDCISTVRPSQKT